MRVIRHSHGLTVRAIAGTNVVELAFDVDESRREGLLGFAIHRTVEGEAASTGEWIVNRRGFAGQDGGARSWPSNEAPVQKFRWADYTAHPAQRYRYRVSA